MSVDNTDTIPLTSSNISPQRQISHKNNEVEVKCFDSHEPRRCKQKMPWFQFLAVCIGLSMSYALGRSQFFFNLTEINNSVTIISKHNTTMSRTKSPLIKKRHIAIFGLESSGTEFYTQTIAKASGIWPRNMKTYRQEYGDPKDDISVIHQSLPWGSTCVGDTSKTIPYLLPAECRCGGRIFYEQECSLIGFNNCSSLCEGRHMVNITNHIRWYQEQGSIATALIVVRDKNVELLSASKLHCPIKKRQELEIKNGVELMSEAIRSLSSKPNIGNLPSVVIASYETLIALGAPYLFHLYKELGISTDFVPILKDGNEHYVSKSMYAPRKPENGPRNLRINDRDVWAKIDEQILYDLKLELKLINKYV